VRIVAVTHNYPRREGDLAGAFIERLLTALVRRGHEADVVTPADRGAAGTASAHGVTVYRLRYAPARWETLAHSGTMADALRSPRGALALTSLVAVQARALRRAARHGLAATGQAGAGRADVVHAHWWIPGGIGAWLARPWGGAPYVVTLHGTDARILPRSAAARRLARRVLRGAAAVTAVSGHVARRAAEVAGLDPASVIVQPMPLETRGPARSSRGGAGVVTVGRLTAQKGVGLILDALGVLKRRGRPRPLTIVGDGPERAALEAQAARAGLLPEVRFAGAVAPEAVAAAVGDADVFAFAGTDEGFGLVAAEAYTLGVPVVATDAGGGVADVVPATGPGRIVRHGDAEAYATALEELIGAPEARRAAAELGTQLRDRLAPDAVAARFEAIFERVAGGRRG
jgi:glycosyltransferase involved in cell wall biosynthesis